MQWAQNEYTVTTALNIHKGDAAGAMHTCPALISVPNNKISFY